MEQQKLNLKKLHLVCYRAAVNSVTEKNNNQNVLQHKATF